jgi:hypothetical protein
MGEKRDGWIRGGSVLLTGLETLIARVLGDTL